MPASVFPETQISMTARSLQEHLASGDSMARIANHAQRLLQFQRLLEVALPEALRPHARVANFRLGKLFIHAANGAVAAKIRQLGPSLASDLSNKEAKVTQIEVRVQARNPQLTQPPHQRPSLPGQKQKQGLTVFTQNLPHESPLRRALERLLRSVKE
ncbi:MAG: DciA family protein [Sulfuritalea sp.]|nr:DciA family protein [Sulfuritalea sp.]